MAIVFVGDISMPARHYPRLDDAFPSFRGPTIANLEGPILDFDTPARGVFNDSAVISFLRRSGVTAVTLANNHITDFEISPAITKERLASAGIAAFGAGSTATKAGEALLLETDGTCVALLGFGWEVIGCRAASERRFGVNPLRPAHVLASIARTKSEYPHAHVVAMMHWNFEGELYPQPMHRQLAFSAVEAGAAAVVGSHPHCVQGIEIHRGAPIVYSLGNWYLPWGVFWGGTLVYPDFMSRQLAFEWGPDNGCMNCHWYEYDATSHELHFVGKEDVGTSDAIRSLTPFAGLDHDSYRAWFRRHRRKRLALPVYDDISSTLTNSMKDGFVAARQWMIEMLIRLQLKGGPR